MAPADRAPVVLRHSRIYILPTRRGFAVIATLLLMLLTSLNYALSLGLAVTFLLGGLVAAALLHTFRNLAGIEVKPLAAGDAFAGDELVFTLSLAAGSLDRRAISPSPPPAPVSFRGPVRAGCRRGPGASHRRSQAPSAGFLARGPPGTRAPCRNRPSAAS